MEVQTVFLTCASAEKQNLYDHPKELPGPAAQLNVKQNHFWQSLICS